MLNMQPRTALENQINSSGASYTVYLYSFVLFTFLLCLRCGGGLAEIMEEP